jgi:hypothetical protein
MAAHQQTELKPSGVIGTEDLRRAVRLHSQGRPNFPETNFRRDPDPPTGRQRALRALFGQGEVSQWQRSPPAGWRTSLSSHGIGRVDQTDIDHGAGTSAGARRSTACGSICSAKVWPGTPNV